MSRVVVDRSPDYLCTPSRGRVMIGELLDLVAALGEHPRDVDAQINKLYEWHNARGVASLQLAFAPAAVAALAIVAQDASTAVAGGLLALTAGVGLWRLLHLQRLHREYVLALGLARAIMPAHRKLARRLHGIPLNDGGEASSTSSGGDAEEGTALYADVGGISMVKYRSKPKTREEVRWAVSKICERTTAAGAPSPESGTGSRTVP